MVAMRTLRGIGDLRVEDEVIIKGSGGNNERIFSPKYGGAYFQPWEEPDRMVFGVELNKGMNEMNPSNFEFAVFVKPWKKLSIPELAKHIYKLGFRWIELPVRAGFACQPEWIGTQLPQAVAQFRDEGILILNVTVALPLDDERMYAACAECGIHLDRVMFERREGENYWAAEKRARLELDAAMPLCERYGFRIGIQNHYGGYVPVNGMGLYHLVKDYDPRYVGAIWDPAHNALEGEEPEPALDMVASHLCIVNLKNAFWQRVSAPKQEAKWKVYWTTGRQGRADWRRVAVKLKAMQYRGAACFSAEYSAEEQVDQLIAEDLAYARKCFA
jgi:sugar phosphate isomerase/epimerase